MLWHYPDNIWPFWVNKHTSKQVDCVLTSLKDSFRTLIIIWITWSESQTCVGGDLSNSMWFYPSKRTHPPLFHQKGGAFFFLVLEALRLSYNGLLQAPKLDSHMGLISSHMYREIWLHDKGTNDMSKQCLTQLSFIGSHFFSYTTGECASASKWGVSGEGKSTPSPSSTRVVVAQRQRHSLPSPSLKS